jgi:hypothetical protein
MMLGHVEFKRLGGPSILLPSDRNDVLRTQHSSDGMVLQNNTAEKSSS